MELKTHRKLRFTLDYQTGLLLMPNQGILGSAITSCDCRDQPPVTQMTWTGVWWIAKGGFVFWPKGKQDLTGSGQKHRTHLYPTDLFSSVSKKQMKDGNAQLHLEVPGTNPHAGTRKGGHCLQSQPYTVPWIQITPSNRAQPVPATIAQQME